MRVLVNSCIRELERVRVRGRRRKPCAGRPQEGRDAVSKIRKADSMEIVIKDSKRCSNSPAVRRRLKTVRGEELI